MADITWTNVTDHAPQLSTVAAAVQADVLAYVNDALDVSLFDGETGPRTKLARIYLAAHMATLNNQAAGGTAGPVASESLGQMSRSYVTAATMLSADGLSLTTYGLQYLSLVKTSAARAPILL